MLMADEFSDMIFWYDDHANDTLLWGAACAGGKGTTADEKGKLSAISSKGGHSSKGSKFVIKDTKRFTKEVMVKHFQGGGTTKFESFARRLRRWKFRKVSRLSRPGLPTTYTSRRERAHCVTVNSKDVGIYSHPMFVKGNFKLCSEMQPIPQVRRSRSLRISCTPTKEVTTTPPSEAALDHKINKHSSSIGEGSNKANNNDIQSTDLPSLKSEERDDYDSASVCSHHPGSQILSSSTGSYYYRQDQQHNELPFQNSAAIVHSLSQNALSTPLIPSKQTSLSIAAAAAPSQRHYAQRKDHGYGNYCSIDLLSRKQHTEEELQQQQYPPKFDIQSGHIGHRHLTSTAYNGLQQMPMDQHWDDKNEGWRGHNHDGRNVIIAPQHLSPLNDRKDSSKIASRKTSIVPHENTNNKGMPAGAYYYSNVRKGRTKMVSEGVSILSHESTNECMLGASDYEPIDIDDLRNDASANISTLLLTKSRNLLEDILLL